MAEKLKTIEEFLAPFDISAAYAPGVSAAKSGDFSPFAGYFSTAFEPPQEKWRRLEGGALETWG